MTWRVLFINHEFPPLGAGAGNATDNIARCLGARGVEVEVLTSAWGSLPSRERHGNVTITRVPVLRRQIDRSSPLEMVSFIIGGLAPALQIGRARRPHVTCAFFGIPAGPLALLMRRIFGVPYLVSLRGGDVPGFLHPELARLHRLSWPVIRTVWYQSAGLIANSDGLAKLAWGSWPDAPLQVIPNGVDVQAFRPSNRARPSQPLRLLFVGRLVPQKGVRYLLAALAQTRSPATARIAGDGPERAELESLVLQLGLNQRVEFVGWVRRPELPEHYQWADVLVLPSFEEGMANVVLEGLAAGLPVITTDIYANRGLIEPGRNGFLVPPADPAAIAAQIDLLADDPDLVRTLATAARDAALSWSWEHVADQYLQALSGAINAAR